MILWLAVHGRSRFLGCLVRLISVTSETVADQIPIEMMLTFWFRRGNVICAVAEAGGNNRSGMPFEVLDRSRVTMKHTMSQASVSMLVNHVSCCVLGIAVTVSMHEQTL